MPFRIEVTTKTGQRDVASESLLARLKGFFDFPISSINIVTVYVIDVPISKDEAKTALEEIFYDPVIHSASLDSIDTGKFDWCIEIGFKPGVTDAVGSTAKGAVEDLLNKKFQRSQRIYTAKQYRISGQDLTINHVQKLGEEYLGNQVIENITVQSYDDWKHYPQNFDILSVFEPGDNSVEEIDLNVDDDSLVKMSGGKSLALSLKEMQTIKKYLSQKKVVELRENAGLSSSITDVELESLAQTWSEHCKHKIFSSRIHYTENGKTEIIDSIFNTYIKKSTSLISGKVPWLLSVFKDNAGVIKFNDTINLVYKVETHNSPSALEPYGGALTGIVGVNRDPMGTGMGSALLFNVWGYCFGSPFYSGTIPKGLLHPNRIRVGVHKGVIDGGNQSGIPYARGWEYFDDRYIGKPVVFCGTVGYLPAEVNEKPSYDKSVNPGDLIVMVGGRIGKDGIHGATFSSEELRQDSPIQAVQIGDPITQKKMSDFLLEARDSGLYSCITDNGAGGLSSSVGEMAQFSGGCRLDLTNAPLKYPGLKPWEILLSEAQERMTLAVPPDKMNELSSLADKRGVEITGLGEFTGSGVFHVLYNNATIAWLEMDFLHDGHPQMELEAVWIPPELTEPDFEEPDDLDKILGDLLGRLNICSGEGVSRQYDHEVKGLSIIKPFVGKRMDVNSDASVFIIEHGSMEGVILAEGRNPGYSDIDTYHMAASAIDEAVRRIIATGGTLNYIAGLDNFCWPDPVHSEKTPDGKYKLAQLVRANKALFDYTTAYGVPCISGKDSMKNDSIMDGIKISIPPTFLFSVIGKIDDISKSVTMDVKRAGDIVYIVGETFFELGGSEYYKLIGEQIGRKPYLGKNIPEVQAGSAVKTYRAIECVTRAGLAHSIHTPTIGGLGVAFSKSAFAGEIGIKIDLKKIPQTGCKRNDHILFSESNSRFIVTVHPDKKGEFENCLKGVTFAEIGITTEEQFLSIIGLDGEPVIQCPLSNLKKSWKNTLKDFFDGIS